MGHRALGIELEVIFLLVALSPHLPLSRTLRVNGLRHLLQVGEPAQRSGLPSPHPLPTVTVAEFCHSKDYVWMPDVPFPKLPIDAVARFFLERF